MKKNLVITMIYSMFLAITMNSHAFASSADADSIFKEAKTKAEADYKLASAKCTALTDNPKDICMAEAKAARVHTEENAQAVFHNTLKAHTNALKKIAEADYDVDKARCLAMVGNEKDVCVKKAKSTKVAAIATAKANKKVIEARKDEAEDKNTAEYKVALEKCDALSGSAKDTCVSAAKKKYGK
jgi:hypothetical protein